MEARKNLPERKKTEQGKNLAGNLGRIQGAYCEKLHSEGYEGYEGYTAGRSLPTFTKHVFQQGMVNSK